jgi:GT2 family glycosyltransferase
MSATPELSVVIAAVNPVGMLLETLESLAVQTRRDALEVLVVNRVGADLTAAVAERFPWVRVIERFGRDPIPVLRAAGAAEARAPVVAIIEDHVAAAPDWAEQLLAAHAAPGVVAVGGAVENGRPDWLNTAVFLTEYVGHMPPIPDGPCVGICGSNASYKREALVRHAADLPARWWESFLHERLAAEGGRVVSCPRVVVSHRKDFGFAYFLSQRWHYGRSFAGLRLAGAGFARRLFYVLASPLVPALLLLMFAAGARAKGRLGELLWTLPLVAVFQIATAAGETWGSAFGPGDSLAEVE